MMKKSISVILVLVLAALCLYGCSSDSGSGTSAAPTEAPISIEGTWVLEGLYASASAPEAMRNDPDIESMNEYFQSGVIVQTTTFANGTATITTSGYGNSTSNTHPYTLNGNQLKYEDEEGAYTLSMKDGKLIMVKDSLELRYHRQ